MGFRRRTKITAWRALISLFVLTLVMVQPISAQSNFLENTEKSNYREGVGNITYPVVAHTTEERGFSRSIMTGDVNGDGKKEIVAVSAINPGVYSYISNASEMDNTLYVYSSNLSLLWKFRDRTFEHVEVRTVKTSSMALGDLNGDGIDDILFSISPSLAPTESPTGTYYPETTLYAFKGDGSQLWNRTFQGGITPESLIIEDIDEDGKNEILVGSDNLYLLDSDGETICTYDLGDYTHRGVSEIISHGNEIVLSFWHYEEEKDIFAYYFRVNNALFNITKLSYDSGIFDILWSKELEEKEGMGYPIHYRMFVDRYFQYAVIARKNPISISLFDLSDGKILWERDLDSIEAIDLGISWKNSEIFVNSGDSIKIFDITGSVKKDFEIYNSDGYEIARKTICVFDADSDTYDEIILIDKYSIISFSEAGKKELDSKLWESSDGYLFPSPVILHSDTDNDGYDEIITTDPEGRIVIINSGSPPESEEGSAIPFLSCAMILFAVASASIIYGLMERKRRGER